jgi:hypothetical protein
MEDSNGWIKLYRKTLDNPLLREADHLAIWVWILLRATREDYDVMIGKERVTLHPGQLVTSRSAIASDLRLSQSKVSRVLDDFVRYSQIEQRSTTHNRVISVLGWLDYQESGQRVDSGWTASEQRVNTNKNIRIREYKNSTKDESIPPTLDQVRDYCLERKNGIDPEAFIAYYDSRGWMLGKNKIKNWKSCIITWEKRQKPKPMELDYSYREGESL